MDRSLGATRSTRRLHPVVLACVAGVVLYLGVVLVQSARLSTGNDVELENGGAVSLDWSERRARETQDYPEFRVSILNPVPNNVTCERLGKVNALCVGEDDAGKTHLIRVGPDGTIAE